MTPTISSVTCARPRMKGWLLEIRVSVMARHWATARAGPGVVSWEVVGEGVWGCDIPTIERVLSDTTDKLAESLEYVVKVISVFATDTCLGGKRVIGSIRKIRAHIRSRSGIPCLQMTLRIFHKRNHE